MGVRDVRGGCGDVRARCSRKYPQADGVSYQGSVGGCTLALLFK